jgi:hypothetical protein
MRRSITHLVIEPLVADAATLEDELRRVEPGEGFDFAAGKTFALETLPGEGGVDYGEMSSPLQFTCKLEVVKDAKDRLNDSHGRL